MFKQGLAGFALLVTASQPNMGQSHTQTNYTCQAITNMCVENNLGLRKSTAECYAAGNDCKKDCRYTTGALKWIATGDCGGSSKTFPVKPAGS